MRFATSIAPILVLLGASSVATAAGSRLSQRDTSIDIHVENAALLAALTHARNEARAVLSQAVQNIDHYLTRGGAGGSSDAVDKLRDRISAAEDEIELAFSGLFEIGTEMAQE
ncbi:hypothetical protein MN608_11350 [Microdochium nivale]|nr:hypothetical protein MN608_11350 [Microdochium nivale]